MKKEDIITHQYFNVDAEEIFYICTTHIEGMRDVLGKIIDELP